MPRVFFGNFDFEHELARSTVGSPPAISEAGALLRQAHGDAIGSELFWAWLPIAEENDCLIAPRQIDLRDFDGLAGLGQPVPRVVHRLTDFDSLRGAELVPWGWTNSIFALGKLYDWQCPAPPLQVVRQVNSRAFRLAFEREWDIGLPGAAIATSLEELEVVLQQQGHVPRGWLLKANFGMSGREALRGRGAVLDEKTRNWALKRLAGSGAIVFEPVVERLAEAGIQIEIPPSGKPELVGVTPLLVDRSGVYRGSRFGGPPSEIEAWQPAVAAGLRAAQAVQRLGYFGPLGIDAMQYRDESGKFRLRALQDINARYTMGRLALGFRRILPVGWCGTWLHFGAKHLGDRALEFWLSGIRRLQSKEVIAVATSPRKIGTQPAVHHAVLVLATTPEIRHQAEGALFDSLGITFDTHRG